MNLRIGEIIGGGVFELPDDVVTESLGILAVKRAGKSNAAVRIAEQMFHRRLHWVAIDPKGDWWGIRADGIGPGLPVAILGGAHGDIPLEPSAGAVIADLIVDQRLTCVLDVSGFASEAEKIRFLLAFGARLYQIKTPDQEPTHVFFEEADDYVPQRAFPEQQRLVHVMAKILKMGGSRGLGGTVISQRSAVVNKDILTQIQTLIALRTTSPQDRTAVKDWVSFNGENAALIATLHELPDGEAWVWSPNWLRLTERVKFYRRETFDSGATPKVGSSRRAPATLADIDLGAIRDLMAGTIERAKAEDPKELRRRISELERRLAAQPAPERVVERVEVPVLTQGERDLLTEAWMSATAASTTLGEVASRIVEALKAREPVKIRFYHDEQPAKPIVALPMEVPTSALSIGRLPPEDSPKLGPTERAILKVLAQFPAGRTQKQVAILSGYSPTSGGFFGALAKLRKNSLIDGKSDSILITTVGLEVLGPYEALPTGHELLGHWLRRLPKAEGTILSVLVDALPSSLSQEEVASRARYSPTSGGFFGALAKLRSLELMSGTKDALRASEDVIGGEP